MTTSKKPETKKSAPKTAAGNSDNFPKAYMRLRTVLDALEIGALQSCLAEETPQNRIKRALEIEELLLDVIEKLKDKTTKPGACADGYNNCGGVCVPYRCPA
jgi:hypothetical protein